MSASKAAPAKDGTLQRAESARNPDKPTRLTTQIEGSKISMPNSAQSVAKRSFKRRATAPNSGATHNPRVSTSTRLNGQSSSSTGTARPSRRIGGNNQLGLQQLLDDDDDLSNLGGAIAVDPSMVLIEEVGNVCHLLVRLELLAQMNGKRIWQMQLVSCMSAWQNYVSKSSSSRCKMTTMNSNRLWRLKLRCLFEWRNLKSDSVADGAPSLLEFLGEPQVIADHVKKDSGLDHLHLETYAGLNGKRINQLTLLSCLYDWQNFVISKRKDDNNRRNCGAQYLRFRQMAELNGDRIDQMQSMQCLHGWHKVVIGNVRKTCLGNKDETNCEGIQQIYPKEASTRGPDKLHFTQMAYMSDKRIKQMSLMHSLYAWQKLVISKPRSPELRDITKMRKLFEGMFEVNDRRTWQSKLLAAFHAWQKFCPIWGNDYPIERPCEIPVEHCVEEPSDESDGNELS